MEINCPQKISDLKSDLQVGVKIFLFLADNLNQKTIDILRMACKNIKQNYLIEIFTWLLGIFIKENYTGPSELHRNVDRKLQLESLLIKQVIPLYKEQPLNLEDFKEIGLPEFYVLNHKICKVSEYEIYHSQHTIMEDLLNYLQCNGEPFRRVIALKHIFLVCIEIQKVIGNPLWLSRLSFMHNIFLDNPVQELKDNALNNYQQFLQQNQTLSQEQLSKLYVELAYMQNYYYRYLEAETNLIKAQSLLKVRFELTGKMGKKTKFQEDNLPQLIAQIIDDDAIKQELQQLPNVNDVLNQYTPENVQLGEESILYEKPCVDGVLKQDQLNISEQIVLLGWINHYRKTLPNDEILQQQITAYLNLMLDKSISWIVYSQGLLLRSLNEFNHLKRMERALGQMQVLVDQYNEQNPEVQTRLDNLFYTNYPDYFQLSCILGEHWMKVGMMSSGYEIFARLEMWEECVECIVGSGDTTRALQEIDKITSKGLGTIKMKCIYGEIKQDPLILKAAWKDSNKRFARAQRSLGEYYFFKMKNYQKSIKAYRKALKVNSYHQKSWYIMGCAQMRLNQFEDAIKSLGEAVRINEQDGEIWGNISTCLIQLKKYNEAMSALEQGVKYANTDWRLWSNLMAVSLRSKKFVRFYSCIERLILLDHRELIDEQIIQKINQTFAYQFDQLTIQNLRQSNINKNRILKLYEHLAKEIGQRYYIWEGLAKYTEILIQYDEKADELENKQSLNSKQLYYNDIAQYRLKSCQMLQILNWEKDLTICEQLLKQLILLNKDIVKLNDQETIKNLNVFVSQQKQRLETIMEKKIDL